MNFSLILKYSRLLLLPFIPLYLLAFYLIRYFSKQERFSVPVICVGNITTGGTGKTPAVICIARILKEMGFSPGIASRGYRGSKSKEGAIVSDGKTILLDHIEAGEEALLIAMSLKNVPVAICSRRTEAVRALICKFNINVVILDDGFQNNSLYKDINIVIIDALNPFAKGLLLPAGNLREPLSSLKRSDAVFINKIDLVAESIANEIVMRTKKQAGGSKIFFSGYGNSILLKMNNLKSEVSVQKIKNKKILLVSGIGNPESFARTIAEYCPADIAHLSYPDHHSYSQQDMGIISRKSQGYDLVITTEKDYIKMRCFQVPDKFYFMRISFVIREPDPFKKWIESYLRNINNRKS
ncbi:MAG: tetraacyldisaccharide 4'-kinase [Spirochaetota bacterium]